MVAGQNYENTFTPEWSGFAVEGLRVAVLAAWKTSVDVVEVGGRVS